MHGDSAKSLPAFGFLTVLESQDHGLFGGYLVLSSLGRPLEFRCSTPVTASRVQEILYGPTLRTYLLAEVVGQALLAGAQTPVCAIMSDQREMLALSLLRSEPVLHVEPSSDGVAPRSADQGHVFEFSGACLTAADYLATTADDFQAMLAPLAKHVDLCEPFDRIRTALTEAVMASHREAEATHGRSAAA